MTPLSHKQACIALRAAGKLLGSGRITRAQWYATVDQTLARLRPDAPSTQIALGDAPQ